ncbi:hypothetical protein CF166_35825, partial [Amycolatopsis sp. KNN50.9b]
RPRAGAASPAAKGGRAGEERAASPDQWREAHGAAKQRPQQSLMSTRGTMGGGAPPPPASGMGGGMGAGGAQGAED